MTYQADKRVDHRRLAANIAPFIVIALAGMAVRTPLTAAYPLASLLLFLWIVADTLMLSMIARTPDRPKWSAVLGVLAGAALTVWLGLPPLIRDVLMETPILAVAMASVVLGHLSWATVRAGKMVNRQGIARKERWVSAASEILPPALVRLAVVEITVIHMAIFRWGGPPDLVGNARPFSYHKHLTPICATLLILSSIEIAVYHLLIGHWSRTATIVLFILSDLGFVYLVGLIKSFRFRPVLLTPDGVRVRAGFLIDQHIPLDAIVAVESEVTGEEVRDPATFNAALLAWPNIMLRLDRPLHRRGGLKGRGPFMRVAFRLDDPEPFIRLLAWHLGRCRR